MDMKAIIINIEIVHEVHKIIRYGNLLHDWYWALGCFIHYKCTIETYTINRQMSSVYKSTYDFDWCWGPQPLWCWIRLVLSTVNIDIQY